MLGKVEILAIVSMFVCVCPHESVHYLEGSVQLHALTVLCGLVLQDLMPGWLQMEPAEPLLPVRNARRKMGHVGAHKNVDASLTHACWERNMLEPADELF